MPQSLWRTIPGFVHVGTLGKHYGTSGELRVRILPGFEENVISAEFLFIDLHGSKVPHRVDNWRQGKDLLVCFSEMTDRTETTGLAGRELYLPSDEIEHRLEEPTEPLHFSYLKGFAIVEHESGKQVGLITDVQSYPQQELGVVVIEGREVLIPIHNDLIEEVDESNSIVRMNIPEGLLEL